MKRRERAVSLKRREKEKREKREKRERRRRTTARLGRGRELCLKAEKHREIGGGWLLQAATYQRLLMRLSNHVSREKRGEERGEAAVSGLSIEPVNGSMTASPAAR